MLNLQAFAKLEERNNELNMLRYMCLESGKKVFIILSNTFKISYCSLIQCTLNLVH